METRTIPEDQWLEFFDGFSRDHVGESVTIEVLDSRNGPHPIAENLPFLGISFDQKGSRASVVQVSAGDALDRHVNHVIDLPLNIREAEEPDGSVDLQIEPARGPVTLIHVSGSVH